MTFGPSEGPQAIRDLARRLGAPRIAPPGPGPAELWEEEEDA